MPADTTSRRPVLSLVAAGLRRGGALISEGQVARSIRWHFHRADFAAGRQTDTFSGCYRDFPEARAAAPPGPIGYDHDTMATLVEPDAAGCGTPMDSSDYAVLFWLKDLMPDARRVFDLGGYIGTAFYAYRRYLTYPDLLDWLVCDVPAVGRAGEAIAARAGVQGLRFTTDAMDADGCDILLAAGSLQYMEEGALHRLIAGLRAPPRHVLVQRTPLHADRCFVTLQVMMPPGGPVFCPYTVAARPSFIEGMRALGYELVDAWTKPRTLLVPLHPECTVPAYSGLYFRRTAG